MTEFNAKKLIKNTEKCMLALAQYLWLKKHFKLHNFCD